MIRTFIIGIVTVLFFISICGPIGYAIELIHPTPVDSFFLEVAIGALFLFALSMSLFIIYLIGLAVQDSLGVE